MNLSRNGFNRFTDDSKAFRLHDEVPNGIRKFDDTSMTISLKHLACVVAAADLGSIARASATLDASPPALSAAIKRTGADGVDARAGPG